HRLIRYTPEFIRSTLPTTAKGTATVQRNLGVKIKYLYYWHSAMTDERIIGHQVPVKYDPFNSGVAYAYIKIAGQPGQWVQCLSEYHWVFEGRTEREIQLATAHLKQKHKNFGGKLLISAKSLAEFLNSNEAQEVLHSQQARDSN